MVCGFMGSGLRVFVVGDWSRYEPGYWSFVEGGSMGSLELRKWFWQASGSAVQGFLRCFRWFCEVSG